MIRNGGGLIDVTLCDGFLYCASVFSKSIARRRLVEKAITQRDIDQPTAVSDHFTLPGHSLNNLELIPLELILISFFNV